MDTNTQDLNVPNNKAGDSHRLIFALLSLCVLIACMDAVYVWQHHKVIALNNQLNNYQEALVKNSKISLDKLNALEARPNVVEDSVHSPTDLIAFLGADNTQCYKNNGSGYYKVVAQANDQFAKMQYGCTAKDSTSPLAANPSFILAKKTNNTWSLLSLTNQWVQINGQDEPSCTMVNDNKISKLVTPQCWQGPNLSSSNGSNNQQRTVIAVTNP